MDHQNSDLWQRFQQYYTEYPSIGLALDLSRMNLSAAFLAAMAPKLEVAFKAMVELEAGSIANPDENRMVGHYWLRNPSLAPTPEIRKEIEEMVAGITSFAKDIHTGRIAGQNGAFKNLLVIGIGGSALGPQFVSRALGHPKKDRLKVNFIDNTDPDGIDGVLAELEGQLGRTLCVVISKSGSTKETRNGMIEVNSAYKSADLDFSKHCVAITGAGSALDDHAKQSNWLCRFPMWDWVGGRTSELSAVGLLPAALQGIDIQSLIAGAKACDALTRQAVVSANPAAQIALAIYESGNGKGEKNMVVLPYKDRLELFSKYLQQLIMESLGKERNLSNLVVNQGLSVFGNKGATDQHSYIQQLRDGINNFFAVFIEVLKDRDGDSLFVEPEITSGDYLSGFFLGTRKALHENGRSSITITINELSPFTIGVLIALFERVVGLYAQLIGVNAYHQPGVEAGKKAAADVIVFQRKILQFLSGAKGCEHSAIEIATHIGAINQVESVFKICNHLAANPDRRVNKSPGSSAFDARYSLLA